ncbi:hypothetical protein D3C72_1937250 [compost metagenome]
MPMVKIDTQALGEIALKARRYGSGQRRIKCLNVSLKVEPQVPVVKVARADAHPVVHQHHLQMQEARLVLIDLHPGTHQARVITMAGITHRRMIGAWPRQQQAHIDTIGCRPAQGAANFPGG